MTRAAFDDALRRARSVNLVEYLIGLGHQPAGPVRPHRTMFHSPLRVDRHPSFAVSAQGGTWLWYDFGTGEHGDVIEFAMRYHGLSFKEAVERLSGERVAPVAPPAVSEPPAAPAAPSDDLDKVEEVRALWRRAKLRQTPEDTAALTAYFERYRLTPVPPELHAVLLTWSGVRYVAIPIPHLQRMRGLECRALDPEAVPEGRRRITLGKKTLWVWRRDSPHLLVTESIMDSLSGDRLYPDRGWSLAALNGIANVEKLTGLVQALRPKAVHLALDNDPDPEKGPAAERRAQALLAEAGVPVHLIRVHHAHGVKDLGALWRALAGSAPNSAAAGALGA